MLYVVIYTVFLQQSKLEKMLRKYIYSTMLHLSKKNPYVIRAVQFKPMLFKGQLYYPIMSSPKFHKHFQKVQGQTRQIICSLKEYEAF